MGFASNVTSENVTPAMHTRYHPVERSTLYEMLVGSEGSNGKETGSR